MSRKPSRNGRVVYSTDHAETATCPRCGQVSCRCSSESTASPDAQHPRVRRETSGRGGKTVTVIYDLALSEPDLKSLAKQLKQVCATGGTVKDGRIEIRGNHRDRIVQELVRRGYRAKAAGG